METHHVQQPQQLPVRWPPRGRGHPRLLRPPLPWSPFPAPFPARAAQARVRAAPGALLQDRLALGALHRGEAAGQAPGPGPGPAQPRGAQVLDRAGQPAAEALQGADRAGRGQARSTARSRTLGTAVRALPVQLRGCAERRHQAGRPLPPGCHAVRARPALGAGLPRGQAGSPAGPGRQAPARALRGVRFVAGPLPRPRSAVPRLRVLRAPEPRLRLRSSQGLRPGSPPRLAQAEDQGQRSALINELQRLPLRQPAELFLLQLKTSRRYVRMLLSISAKQNFNFLSPQLDQRLLLS